MTIRDGEWRLFDYDHHTQISKWILYHGDGSFTIREDQPVSHIVEANKEDLNASAGKRWGDGQRTASIPLNVYEKHLKEARLQGDHAYVKKWLNDSDNAAFRTFGGKV